MPNAVKAKQHLRSFFQMGAYNNGSNCITPLLLLLYTYKRLKSTCWRGQYLNEMGERNHESRVSRIVFIE